MKMLTEYFRQMSNQDWIEKYVTKGKIRTIGDIDFSLEGCPLESKSNGWFRIKCFPGPQNDLEKLMSIYATWNKNAIKDLERWTEGDNPKLKEGDKIELSLLKPTSLARLFFREKYDFNFYSNAEVIEGYYKRNTIICPFQEPTEIYVPNANKTWREGVILLSKNPQGRIKTIPLKRIVRIEIKS